MQCNILQTQVTFTVYFPSFQQARLNVSRWKTCICKIFADEVTHNKKRSCMYTQTPTILPYVPFYK